MMKYFLLFITFLIINSCNHSKKNLVLIINKQDTVINYDIDNISSEGAEAHVLYKKGKIKEGIIYIYGAGGKTEIKYVFNKTFISVREQTYLYQDTFFNQKDTLGTLDYKIDYRGNIKEKKLSQYTDIFNDFKKAVPFILYRKDVD